MNKWLMGGLAGIVLTCLGCQQPNSIDSNARKILKNSKEIRNILELNEKDVLTISGVDENGILIFVPKNGNYSFYFYTDADNDGEYDTILKGNLKAAPVPQKKGNDDKMPDYFKRKSNKEIFAYLK